MPPESKHLPADERRAATVQAVVALAARSNPSELTTARIAQHMGLTQGALFKHFPTKDSMLEAVMGWVAGSMMSRVDAAASGAVTPLAALERLFLAHADFVVAHPGVPRIVFAELQRAAETPTKRIVQALLRRYAERVRAILLAAQAQGEVDASLDTEAASTLFVGMIQGLVMQAMLSGDVSIVRSAAPHVFSIYRRGIGSER